MPAGALKGKHIEALEKVVLVHRLREVQALVGFTRFEAMAPSTDGELDAGVQRAALAREPGWFPAIETRGEGIFLHFRSDRIDAWAKRPAVIERRRALAAGFDEWLHDHPQSRRQFCDIEYLMLHSLSHLLITAVSLSCGYPASSIRERIYARPEGCGILLYTASSDSEGTLGGLVEVGRNIDKHLAEALEVGRLCSNDPVCAQHEPSDPHEERFLHGAACHGCLLISETASGRAGSRSARWWYRRSARRARPSSWRRGEPSAPAAWAVASLVGLPEALPPRVFCSLPLRRQGWRRTSRRSTSRPSWARWSICPPTWTGPPSHRASPSVQLLIEEREAGPAHVGPGPARGRRRTSTRSTPAGHVH